MSDNKKILVIDESEFLREAVKKFLEEYKFSVITCGKGILGVKEAVDNKPDLIILELILPSFTGIDVIKSLSSLEITKKIPIIAMTSHKEHDFVSQAVSLGISDLIIKPLNKRTLVSSVLWALHLEKSEIVENESLGIHNKSVGGISVSQTEIRNIKIKMFLNQIEKQIAGISSLYSVKNERMLKSSLSELRIQGDEIGSHRLAMLCKYVEDKITENMKETQWKEINEYLGKIKVQLVNIKTEYSEKEK
jgi:DNA-binding response OmpR family regulator